MSPVTSAPAASRLGARSPQAGIGFPQGLAPMPVIPEVAPDPASPLPPADVVVITWTVDELAALAKVFSQGHSAANWSSYTHGYDQFAQEIRKAAPAYISKRLGSYQVATVGDLRVLCFKSELHLNQDRIILEAGKATLPVKDLFKQIIAETGAQTVVTTGTAGSVIDHFRLGDVAITRAAKFRLRQEFRNEPYNDSVYTSNWEYPTTYFDKAEELMAGFSEMLAEPPFAAPTDYYQFAGPPINPDARGGPGIKIEQGARDMAEWLPILTTDYFEYGTTANGLGDEGCAVEMGDAVLGLACTEIANPPNWLVVRNMSDPVINGALPARQFRLNEQTTWAVGYYTAYGKWTSLMSALAVWAVIAGIAAND